MYAVAVFGLTVGVLYNTSNTPLACFNTTVRYAVGVFGFGSSSECRFPSPVKAKIQTIQAYDGQAFVAVGILLTPE